MTTKENILKLLRNKKAELSSYGVVQVGLFGSYLRNEQTASSDIDLLLDFDPAKETFDNFMAACDIVENLFGSYRVEVVTRNGLSKHIGPHILSNIVYV